MLPAQRVSGPELAEPVAVHRCGVEVAHAGVPGALEHRIGNLLVDLVKDVADRRGAEAEGRDLQVDAAEPVPGAWFHESFIIK